MCTATVYCTTVLYRYQEVLVQSQHIVGYEAEDDIPPHPGAGLAHHLPQRRDNNLVLLNTKQYFANIIQI